MGFLCLKNANSYPHTMKTNLKSLLAFTLVNLSILTATGQVKPEVKVLNEVVITNQRPLIKRKSDRIIYDLKADPESKGNNLLMMMRKIPYLSLDGNDNLLLKGNSSFRVMIDGRPSGSLENNLKAVLKSIPASTIERIEVITIPPSKYDAEGLAGIINIITSKRISDGYNALVNFNESGPVGGPGIGTSFSAKSGKIGLSVNAGGNAINNPETANSSYRQGFGQYAATLNQQGSQKSDSKTGYLSTGINYQIDSLHLLTAQFNYNGAKDNSQTTQFSALKGTTSQQYQLFNEGKANYHGLDAGINYELGFKAKKNQLLTLYYLFSTNENDKKGIVQFSNQVNFSNPDFHQDDLQKFKEHTFQLDFGTPFKNLTMEAGLKGILRRNTSDFQYRSLNGSGTLMESDPQLSNAYTNTQNVFSAYNSYQLNLSTWNINGGIRIEQTVIRADFLTTATLANQNYLNVVPSISISKQFKNESNINLGFSQRIRRPGINRLNPYVDRSNPNFEVTGNPGLRPVVLNNVQLGYGSNKKIAVNLGLDYSFMNNLDLQIVHFDPVTQISRITYANTGKSSSIGLNYNFGYSAGSYRVSVNGNMMYLWLAGQVDQVDVENNLLMYSATLSNVLRLKRGWAVNADLTVNSESPTGLQGRSNGFVYTAFNFNKDLIKDKFGIAGGIKNPFTKYRMVINKTSGGDFNQVYQSQNYFRSFNISLNYKFGGLKDGLRRNKVGIENNDLGR